MADRDVFHHDVVADLKMGFRWYHLATPSLPSSMAKESFFYPDTHRLLDLLEETSSRSGVSRAQAFEDFLYMTICSLSGQQMEEQYLQTVAKHTSGERGKRGCDSIAHLFGELIRQLEETRGEMKDVLGDLFQGAITYGEAGQFLTPETVCRAIALVTVSDLSDDEAKERKSVCDPCCGSGRMLLAVAEIQRHWEFVGQDIDLRCVRMTAINLALRNLYGYVIWGNSLGDEKKLVYRTGFNLRGFIRELPLSNCPRPVHDAVTETITPLSPPADPPQNTVPKSQLRLF